MGQSAKDSRLWLGSIRSAERDRFAFLVSLAALIHLAQTLGLVGSEALFLARLGAARLPATFVLASAVTVLASLLYAVRVGRARNDAVFVEMLLLGSAAIAAVGSCAALGWSWPLPLLLCLFFATQAVYLSHFWTFSGDLFDTLAAKRVAPLFGVGMSVGGAIGGAIALSVSSVAPPYVLILLWALTLAAAAGLVRWGRRRLRRWGALETEEEDETSVAGLRAALRYLHTHPFARWLAMSSLAMVLALFAAQYLYSEIFARSFPDEAQLARFLGLFLAVTNLAEVGVELWLTPGLIRRAGVASAHLVHPVLTALSFLALAVDFRLPAAIASRVTREPLENAVAGPVRNLVYNALPQRLRARVRAFLEGIVVYSGMSVAGGALLLLGALDRFWLCSVGGGMALLYLAANARLRREYLRALVSGLRAGVLELTDVSAEVGRRELAELARVWERLLQEETDRPAPILRELAPLLAERGFEEALRSGLDHPHAVVREVSLDALAARPEGLAAESWRRALDDPHPSVRTTAFRKLPSALTGREDVARRLRQGLRDATPTVRAEAALRLGGEGHAVLSEMTRSGTTDEAVAALDRLPAALYEEAQCRFLDRDPTVRAAALEAWSHVAPPDTLDLSEPAANLEHGDARVRRAAVGTLARQLSHQASAALARALQDASHEVRSAAVSALAARGDAGVEAARSLLAADNEAGVEAALRVLGGAESTRGTRWLVVEYRQRVREAWTAWLCLEALPEQGPLPLRFLRIAYVDTGVRSLRLAFRALALLEDPHVVRRVERALRFASRRARAAALEVLSNLGPREVSERLVLLLEPGPLAEKRAGLEGFVAPARDVTDAIERGAHAASRWVRWAVAQLAREDEVLSEERKMERLLFLRSIPLFSQLSLEQLEAIELITRTVEYVKKEVIVREGTPGEELYLLEEGEVVVFRGYGSAAEVRLNELGPGSYFGEMAVLDGALRSATVVAATDARLLVLDGERFRELVHERPEMAFEIFRVLTARLRTAERRLTELSGEGASTAARSEG
jgi:CRP-like cAMP-binding protein